MDRKKSGWDLHLSRFFMVYLHEETYNEDKMINEMERFKWLSQLTQK